MNETLENVYDDNLKIKELLFKLKGKCYPATNQNIKTMTYIRLLNQTIGKLEIIANSLIAEIRNEDDGYFVLLCTKCNDQLMHRNEGKKTARCLVCWKRNTKEENL